MHDTALNNIISETTRLKDLKALEAFRSGREYHYVKYVKYRERQIFLPFQKFSELYLKSHLIMLRM